ncbi:hypothetical protein R1sor_007321 [Riccia sorocarpa]|uniref:Protein kinase domain-containing protein n=1 Tax=Riccia sorocarpa TaxID=122646 RepID=A0ABD3HTR1_9MARC
MADSVNAVLEYLRKHNFSEAESALRLELSARQNGNGPIPLPLEDELDLNVNIFQKALQEKPSQHPSVVCPEPDFILTSPEMTKGAHGGFNFIHSKSDVHDDFVFRGSPQTPLEEKAVFVDSGVEKPSSPASPRSPKLGKSSTQRSAGFNLEKVNFTGDLPGFHSGAQASDYGRSTSYKKNTAVIKQSHKHHEEAFTRREGSTSMFGQETLHSDLSAGGEDSAGHVVASDVTRTLTRKQEDVSFEEVRLVEAHQMHEDAVEQIGSPQWISSLQQERPGVPLPLMVVPQKTTKSSTKRAAIDQEKRAALHESQDNGVQHNNGVHHTEKPMLVRDLIANERASKGHAFLEEAGKVQQGRIGADNLVTEYKEKRLLDNGGFGRDITSTTSWKDVPIKTSFPLTPPVSTLSSDLPLLEPPVVEVGKYPGEEKLPEEKRKAVEESSSVRSVNVSAENIRSADEVLKVTEGISKSLSDAREELPKLPPVKLRSTDIKPSDPGAASSMPSGDAGFFLNLGSSAEAAFGLGSFLDIPVGQDVTSSGQRRLSGGSRPSVSQGIVEDSSERLSCFPTAGDGQSESIIEYPDEYWDSDTYDDDDDPGFHRQLVEDEEWFLAHEIDYPDERSSPGLESSRSHHDKDYGKYEDDDRSLLEEESYFSGEEYYRVKRGERREVQNETDQLAASELYSRHDESKTGPLRGQTEAQLRETPDYDGQLLDVEELNMLQGEPVWQGFAAQGSRLVTGDDKVIQERIREDVGSVRSGGVGISSEVAEFGSELRESVVDGSSEGDVESFKDREMGVYGSVHGMKNKISESPENRIRDVQAGQNVLKVAPVSSLDEEEVDHELILRLYSQSWYHKRETAERQVSERDRMYEQEKNRSKGNNGNADEEQEVGDFGFGGFSVPSPSSGGEIAVMSRADSGKSLWSVRHIVTPSRGNEGDEFAYGIVGPDDTLAVWKRKSSESSPIISPQNETLRNLTLSTGFTISARSTDGYGSGEIKEGDDEDEVEMNDNNKEEVDAVAADDEEAAAVQEQIRRIRAEEEEFETFNLKIVHRKNRTGFEENKDFPVVINSVIAGRYHVTEYLGSAAFSKAIQAHDLHTGMDVCMKIIKNNKDFFDQSLDEIKLLKYINKHDPGDKYHVLRLYDYFYHREHLFIVCELLRANLYEFHKYNRESGGEVYFTMPRLQSITRQCLEALEFIHGLGLIHCDLKPENILVKSYSRCEVKVIDLGSSCFQTDHLCSYVQSRSYRAPEVILGLPYNQKIDMWSLGCILAELCSGNVLFQNESLATLMARVVGILGPIEPEMLAKGRDTHKYFTKNHMLYERNPETDQLEYLLPKKTSLAHRLPMGDQGFVEFVGYLLNINPAGRPTASEALKHPWLSYPYEPISA